MRTLRRLHTEEHGATAVMIGLVLFVLMAAGAIAVDLGNAWRVRQIATTATDSASLAEARRQAFVDFPSGQCDPAWTDLLVQNAPDADIESSTCIVQTTGPGTGYVVVETTIEAETFFAGLFNIDSQTVYASSGAMYGYLTTLGDGLRPIGLCATNSHIAWWLQNDLVDPATVDPSLHGEHSPEGWDRMWFNPAANIEPCGDDAAGNWGWLDFNDGGGGANEIDDWLYNGFDEFPVAVGDCNASTPDPTRCPGQTGAQATHGDAVQYLCDNAISFWAVVFATAEGSGAKATFDVHGFVPVVIRGFQFPATPGGGQPSRHAWDGTSCADTGEVISEPTDDGLLTLSDPVVGTAAAPGGGNGGGGGTGGGRTTGGTGGTTGGGSTTGGQGGGPSQDWFLEFEIRDEMLATGTCCTAASSLLQLPKDIRLCTVDHDPQSLDLRCAPTVTD